MKEYCSNMKVFKPEISLVLFLWNELEALLLPATWTYPAFLLWQFCRCKLGQLWLFFYSFRSKDACKMLLPEKLTTCKRTIIFALTQGIAERGCLVGEVLSRSTPAYSGCEKLFQIVGSLVFLIFITQVRWRPFSLDKTLEASDSGCENFCIHIYSLPLP